MKQEGKYKKYQWVELNLKRKADDFRPESFYPADISLPDIEILNTIDTSGNWRERKQIILESGPKVYTSLSELIEDSKSSNNISLATFKPSRITKFSWQQDDRDWKAGFKRHIDQHDMFDERDRKEIQNVRKVPYKFYYHFEDENGKSSRMMIEDWEIGALYWTCLKAADGNEEKALIKEKQRFFDIFTTKNDIYFFLGTTMQFHRRRASNPFVIIGVFYPLKERPSTQTSLFG
ncbi:MAG: hypothetical protein WD491_03790 [Balneolales bacterium]